MSARTYLDAGGRAPLHPRARQAFDAATDEGWADPRRLHAEGRRARLLLDGARESLAGALGCRTEEVHLSAHHTASLHAAVLAISRGRRRIGARVVVSAVERSAVLAAARFVADETPAGRRTAGLPDGVDTVGVDRWGRVDLDRWQEAVSRRGVALAALQHANGEVGTLQPLGEAYGHARAAGVPLVVDAGASVGHVPVQDTWDALAADPADWGGPAGVAVLAVRSRVRAVRAWPEDEDPWFPGGVSVPAALAAAAALQAVLADRERADPDRRALVDLVRSSVARTVPDVEVVGHADDRLPHIVTFSCLYVDGEALLTELDRRGYAVGSGSACTSGTLEPSHVLGAMGTLTHGNVRLVLPRGTVRDDVERFLHDLPEAVAEVRRMIGATGL
ncbi:aminotransferase class V-fold PLP-dependent enzyme [Actinotalea sp. K2]|uniref:cysteine desulfurase family protein n=1 Tax=Actinotalea sp. K2 TaxID=2939438 RepID=UPI002017D282|nr:aminotransferase class V-fold PLP-dependent enzyme [Actinotalea sp. K2]MCL3862156.1 aminotransferase class V-fold PLP-dependent enzyme [Actinotalea sp. K2]